MGEAFSCTEYDVSVGMGQERAPELASKVCNTIPVMIMIMIMVNRIYTTSLPRDYSGIDEGI